ncbi:putative gon7 family protein [Rosellinia necatrix]|uniref:EKC/KEOPS complex subunit GON7 n=1 Tax=Rosellinia necatrix TaxID=77044 RepID=A0A1W2TVZ3_ROSNE|nr:putative gon7 family protein [Rosellinia necatrix]
MASDPRTAHLKATYTSPNTTNTPQTLSSTPLVLPADQTVESKTAYLRALRAATISLQDRINAELTARMEEDVRNAQQQQQQQGNSANTTAGGKTATTREASAKKTQGGGVIDEAAEEENYGEEIVGDDDDV